jgi:hypothetical protein
MLTSRLFFPPSSSLTVCTLDCFKKPIHNFRVSQSDSPPAVSIDLLLTPRYAHLQTLLSALSIILSILLTVSRTTFVYRPLSRGL